MAGRFSGAYLAGGERAALGWPNHFARPDDRAAAVAKAAARRAAPEALAALGPCVGDSAARARQLSRLEREGAVAVVTGQQVGLLLGPLYTIYKAASAIQVARALEAETGRPAVPVFWIQDEDHDFEEVAQAVLPRSGEPLRLGLAPDPAQARVSMAHRVLGPGIAALQDALQTELGRLPHGPEHLAALVRAYRPEATWPQAFQALMAELFEPEGLLFLDPRSAPLMRSEAVRRMHAQALTE
ncbi:MAG: bacillithiol biosynthesis BshC, partial [Myxococcales bacterium]|nr:bacillithiol biosynthesis BshC [Myxococcales bacterium]